MACDVVRYCKHARVDLGMLPAGTPVVHAVEPVTLAGLCCVDYCCTYVLFLQPTIQTNLALVSYCLSVWTHPPNFFTPSRLPLELRPLVVLPPAAFDAHRTGTQVAPVAGGRGEQRRPPSEFGGIAVKLEELANVKADLATEAISTAIMRLSLVS